MEDNATENILMFAFDPLGASRLDSAALPLFRFRLDRHGIEMS